MPDRHAEHFGDVAGDDGNADCRRAGMIIDGATQVLIGSSNAGAFGVDPFAHYLSAITAARDAGAEPIVALPDGSARLTGSGCTVGG